jgi:hypothetical protein
VKGAARAPGFLPYTEMVAIHVFVSRGTRGRHARLVLETLSTLRWDSEATRDPLYPGAQAVCRTQEATPRLLIKLAGSREATDRCRHRDASQRSGSAR